MARMGIVTLIFLVLSCAQESGITLRLGYFSVHVPEEFEVIDTAPEELLKLNYKNQFFVVFQDHINNNMNLTQEQRDAFDRTLYTLRFQKVRTRYKGFYVKDPRYWEIQGNKIISREFTSLSGEVEVYYDYSIIKIGEKYVEILVTGKMSQRQEHIPIINRLLISMKKV